MPTNSRRWKSVVAEAQSRFLRHWQVNLNVWMSEQWGKKSLCYSQDTFFLSFHDGLFVLSVTKAGNMGRCLVFYDSREKKPDFSLSATDGRNVVDLEKIHAQLFFSFSNKCLSMKRTFWGRMGGIAVTFCLDNNKSPSTNCNINMK